MSSYGAFSRSPSGFVLHLGPDERGVVARLLAELRALLTTEQDASAPALTRLFPVVHPDDPEREAEYQRLMRDELVSSRLAAIDAVDGVLGRTDPGAVTLDEGQLNAFMQAVNSVRLVLGTLLDVSEDDTVEDMTGALAPEYHLYAYLSWLLESAVGALSGFEE